MEPFLYLNTSSLLPQKGHEGSSADSNTNLFPSTLKVIGVPGVSPFFLHQPNSALASFGIN